MCSKNVCEVRVYFVKKIRTVWKHWETTRCRTARKFLRSRLHQTKLSVFCGNLLSIVSNFGLTSAKTAACAVMGRENEKGLEHKM